MITVKTLFVLGAGASAHLAFPLGGGLLTRVIDESLSLQHFGGFKIKEIEAFRDALSRSGSTSIDEWLEHNPRFLGIGKAAIAFALMGFENPHNLFATTPEFDWYKHLAHKMRGRSLGDVAKNNVAFITFNYDRSLEQYLFTMLQNFYGAPPEADIAKILEAIPFVHVHGKLGFLPWEGKQPELSRAYDNQITAAALSAAAAGIQVVSDKTEDELIQKLTGMIQWADRIYFLGFGYLPVNMQKLGLKGETFPTQKEVMGTCVGLKRRERRSVLEKFKIDLTVSIDGPILNWLREHIDLEAEQAKS